jgi:hypothetical protein
MTVPLEIAGAEVGAAMTVVVGVTVIAEALGAVTVVAAVTAVVGDAGGFWVSSSI